MIYSPSRRSSSLLILLVGIPLSLFLLYDSDSVEPTFSPSKLGSKIPYWSNLTPPTSINKRCLAIYFKNHTAPGHLYLDDATYRDCLLKDSSHEVETVAHPMLQLISDAKLAWNTKLASQSTSLSEAAKEYKRRYGRAPPRGFEKWYAFTKEKNVPLVDEYDSIYKAIEPFFAIPPRIYRARAKALNDGTSKWANDIFTITIKEGKTSLSGQEKVKSSRPKEMLDLLEPLAHLLPDMEIPISFHDLPYIGISAANRDRHIKHARANTLLSPEQAEDPMRGFGIEGWAGTCPPDSAFRLRHDGLEPTSEYTRSSGFIVDHVPAMDICHDPELYQRVGFLSMTRPGMYPFQPLFSFSHPSGFTEMPITPMSQYWQETGPDPSWESKTRPGLLWRGSTTGIDYSRRANWRQSQRSRLVGFTNAKEGERTVRWTEHTALNYFTAPASKINQRYYDTGFTGKAAQCDVGDGTCPFVESHYTFKPQLWSDDNNNYKYIADVDGNGWSGRFHRLMSTKSVILKSTVFPEWYADRIQPWYHYVPLRVDYHDLDDIMAFFMGNLEGQGSHDDLGKSIGQNGADWARDYWRVEDMQAYMLRILLEYGRLLNRDDNDLASMDYV